MTQAEATSTRGPVSAAIEQEVLGEVRRQGIVIWLDKDGHYTHLVDDLARKHASGSLPFPVVGFRGSLLDLLFQLEPYGSGLDKQPLLLHMPGFTEQSIRETPVLELYEPGVRFRKGLDTLVREAAAARVAPAEVEKFLASQPTLEGADAWLAAAVSQRTFGLQAQLDEFGPRMLVEALARPDTLAPRITGDEEVATLRNYVHRLTGMDAEWASYFPHNEKQKPLERVLHELGGWMLAVEYVHDLRRPAHEVNLRRLKDLSAPLVKACSELAAGLRKESGDAYEHIAGETEAFLANELAAMTADDLGRIDTFREEENRVLAGAVDALLTRDWAKAKAWCEERQGDASFWLQRDQLRRWAWTLLAEAAEFGLVLARHERPLAGARTLDEATERYAAGAYEADRAHRRFEQRRLQLLESRLPHYGALREVATELRQAHRAWADQLARDFTALCKDTGFLPSSRLRQRNFFEQVVHPLVTDGEKVAVFVIDALRFEMASELVEELKGAGTQVDLKPRLAELPTITAVGMNVLAPVASNERLTVAGTFQGFKTGEVTVRSPQDRSRAMGMRSTNKPALYCTLSDVCEASTAALTKDVKPHQLIVVHSKEIDDAGEANIGLPTFESTLRQIKAAWHHLQLAGVKSFVFTADHGFLLQDETTKVQPFGSKRDPQRRHVLDEHPRQEAGMVNVSLSALGYEGLSGYLLFREDTAVFATGNAGASFVHGGNSPQERVIPVLTVTRKRVEQVGYSSYDVEVEPMNDVMGLHRLRMRVVFSKQTTASLGFAATASVDLAVRVPGRDEVLVTLKDVSGPAKIRTGRLQVPVGDAWTEVFFGIEGPGDERVKVEIHHPDNIERVTSASPDAWYAVSGGALRTSTPPPAVAPAGWSANIEDEAFRRVFLHIEKHGSVTSAEVDTLLGSARAGRRFSGQWEEYIAKLPFRVRIEMADGTKRFVKEGDR